MTPVVDWFADWADLADDREPDPKTGLQLVALAATDADLIAFDVDFGTAPAEALEDLIGTLKDMGATHVVLGTFDQDAEEAA